MVKQKKNKKKKGGGGGGGRGRNNNSSTNNNTASNSNNVSPQNSASASASAASTRMDDALIAQIVTKSEGLPMPVPSSDVDSIILDPDEEEQLDFMVTLIVTKNAVPTAFVGDTINLKRRMKEIWFCYDADNADFVLNLREYVMHALYHEDFNSNTFSFGRIAYPLLIMFCQWKMMRILVTYLGGDEMVEIALKMGADPNCSLMNKVTPIFLAVKYGSPTTVQLLVDAGCNMGVLDCHERTCLYNTVERCDPKTVKIILDHLPANEKFWTHLGFFNTGNKHSYTAIDWILRLYESPSSVDSITELATKDLHASWKIIGKPTINDICTTIILLRQKGCTFSPNNLRYMGRYFHELPISENSTAMAFKNEKKLLIRSIVGLYLPPTIRVELHATKIDDNLKISQSNECVLKYECPICLESIDDPKREIGVTLYCGHSFCWRCICTYGRSSDDGHNRWCPMCRKLLCREVCSRRKLGLGDLMMHGNRDRSDNAWGTSLMTQQQLRVEYFSRKLTVPIKSIPEDKLATFLHLDDIDSESLSKHTGMMSVNPELISKDTSTMLDLGTTYNAAYGTPDQNGEEVTSYCLSPALGRVVIPLTLKGIPILAYVSSKSLFTVASTAFVDNFDLRRKNLKSKQFVAINGLRMDDITGLDEFELKVGAMSLKINTAIESPYDHDFLGLQLGMDFFTLLAYCSFDVNVGESNDGSEKSFMRSSIVRNQFCSSIDKEEMRLYGRHGEIHRAPILHITPDSQEMTHNTTISTEASQRFEECNWCCRVFPNDMLACSKCTGTDTSDYAYYCDKECQDKAFLVHKQRCGTKTTGCVVGC